MPAFIFYLFGFLFIRKINVFNYLLVAVSISTIINILGEFIFRTVLYICIDRMGFLPSITLSISKIPASILTGVLTSVLVVIIYPPLEHSLLEKTNIS